MDGLIASGRELVKQDTRDLEPGSTCPMCRTGELEELPSGMIGCSDCNFSD